MKIKRTYTIDENIVKKLEEYSEKTKLKKVSIIEIALEKYFKEVERKDV